MRLRVLLTVFCFALTACGAAYRKEAGAPPAAYGSGFGGGGGGGAPMSAPGTMAMESDSVYSAEAKPGDVTTVSASAAGGDGGQGGNTTSVPTIKPPKEGEMLDTEAHLTIQVEKVSEAAAKLRELVKQHGGTITADTVNDNAGSVYGQFSMRIPSANAEAFLNSTEGLGHVRDRQVATRDVGKEYFDAQLQLENLETAMKRYEEILVHAKDVKEILVVEAELTRLRGQIESVKGNLRWLKDRVSRATIHVNLTSNYVEAPTFNPQAKLFPGLRFTTVTDLRGEAGNYGYMGAGFSLQFNRAFSIDIDGLRRINDGLPTKGINLLLLTLGGEFYSDFLGGGHRRFLNPYLGFRAGYARTTGPSVEAESLSEMVLGGTLGLEIYKNKTVTLDAQVRMYALFGTSELRAHVAVQPALGFNIAF
jgi:hypothetical protein